MKSFKEFLIKVNIRTLSIDNDLIKWVDNKTIEEVVKECPYARWFFQISKTIGIPNKQIILAKGLCANTVRHLIKDKKVIIGIDAAISFGKGKRLGEEKLKSAGFYAYSNSYALYSDEVVADSYKVGVLYTNYFESLVARKENRLQTANICRKILGQLIINRINDSKNSKRFSIMKTWLRDARGIDGESDYKNGWGNGYVIIPKGHPLHGIEYDEINEKGIDVHGGLTCSVLVDKKLIERFSDEYPPLNDEDIGTWLVGFDTMHYIDNIINCNKEFVESETERLKEQIISYGK